MHITLLPEEFEEVIDKILENFKNKNKNKDKPTPPIEKVKRVIKEYKIATEAEKVNLTSLLEEIPSGPLYNDVKNLIKATNLILSFLIDSGY